MLRHKLKLIVATLLTVFTITTPVIASASPFTLLADAKSEICNGIGTASNGSGCNNGGGPSVEKIIQVVVNILSVVGGIIAVIMIIVAGLKYITSSGDSTNTASAKNTLLYAIVGIIVIAVAQIIVQFVIKKVT